MSENIKEFIEKIFKQEVPVDVLIFKSISEVNHVLGHPYTVGPAHIKYASEHYGGILGNETAEKVKCAHPGCNASYGEHKYDTVLFLQLPGNVRVSIVQKYLQKFDAKLKELWFSVHNVEYAQPFAGFAFVETVEQYRMVEDVKEKPKDEV